jgi:23S rRNA (cytidine1920-2'-O)/16S rRNA (cytidine1409-2'-O)-methyltransferase
MSAKTRLDVLLVERGLVESRALAQRLIMAGKVRVDGQVELKPSRTLSPSADLAVDPGRRFVSRGGLKLEAALLAFQIQVEGRVCADVGASTGGFTDCLLQHGAGKVYAIDVGRGQLDWRLRQDGRVIVKERTNARQLTELPEPIQLVTADVAFISLRLLFARMRAWLAPGGQMVCLVKPQFEAGRRQVGKGGVVRDPAVQRAAVSEVILAAERVGFIPAGLLASPIKGPKGNQEYLLWCRTEGAGVERAALLNRAFASQA